MKKIDIKKFFNVTNAILEHLPVKLTIEQRQQENDRVDMILQESFETLCGAFGGCFNCYGKGYSTQISQLKYSADFVGDETYYKNNFPYLICTHCERGTQIKNLIENTKQIYGKSMV